MKPRGSKRKSEGETVFRYSMVPGYIDIQSRSCMEMDIHSAGYMGQLRYYTNFPYVLGYTSVGQMFNLRMNCLVNFMLGVNLRMK